MAYGDHHVGAGSVETAIVIAHITRLVGVNLSVQQFRSALQGADTGQGCQVGDTDSRFLVWMDVDALFNQQSKIANRKLIPSEVEGSKMRKSREGHLTVGR